MLVLSEEVRFQRARGRSVMGWARGECVAKAATAKGENARWTHRNVAPRNT